MTTILKVSLGTAIAGATMLSLTAPASSEILFRGAIKITALSAICSNISVGDFNDAQFHPASALGNFNASALNRFRKYSASSWVKYDGAFTTAFQQVSNVGIGWTDYTPQQPAFILISKQTPATIVSTTNSIVLEGRVKNPNGETGQENCIANFRMIGLKEID